MSLETGQQIKRRGRSKYRGVHFHKSTGKWRAVFCFGYNIYHIGLFTNQIAAAKAYRKKRDEFIARLKERHDS